MTPLKRLFSAGYRVFFLLAGLFAIVSMIVWEGWLAIHAGGGMVSDMPFAMAPHLWHAHELIFGYGSVAIAGFLMTAAPNWTKSKGAGGLFYFAMSALWLAGRMGLWWSGSLSPVLVAALDLAFLPLVAGRILAMLLARPKPQQMILLALISLIWVSNLMVHLEWIGLTDDTVWSGLRGGLLALAALIVILGGRVTPAFTRNAMRRTGRETGLPRDKRALAIAAIGTAIGATLAMLAGLPDDITGLLALVAGAAALGRLLLWQGLWTWRQPILWTLHLSYATVALGLMALGSAMLGIGSEVAALHILGIGGVGGMTVSVMSRAAIGHSGRELVAPGGLVIAYALVPLATLARFAGSAFPAFYYPGVLLAGGLWIALFTFYVATLWPVFWGVKEPAGNGATA
ncbi:NnrS family protein [Rhodalgimonas zhirmunskyi]|uniref:NnrS family protein n=1 Tax=Rhodalgimonas zhirmunskyi TaxID=2964767 RepID=A0AAJ1UC27_9RHOB|nr:NnrS family protein [Rhodoalgimonas zhirmunskyi]MDQ2095128.1 NnrS family protein [Rhodoalgimonas zhirmunskyi]